MAELFQSSFHENRIAKDNPNLEWTIAPLSNGSIVLVLESSCSIQVNCQQDSKCEIFVLNHAKDKAEFNIHIHCENDSYCKMGLLDLEQSSLQWKQMVELNGQGAEFEILSAQLCAPKINKVGNIEVCHNAGHTFGHINNFAVLSDEGQYEMEANGNIKRSCHEAQSHQKTRVLTLGKNHKAKVIPLLLIDENNVKASHALSIGQPDEDQLYYLQSRGLSKSQALGLLSIGYFLPVIEMLEDEDLKQSLQEEMERKVGLYGRK